MSRLMGKRVVVTRATHQAAELAQRLEARGALPVLYPCIEIVPPTDASALDAALQNAPRFTWWVFTSVNTVIAVAARLSQLALAVDWQTVQVAAIGTRTADAARTLLGVMPAFVPDVQAAAHLAETLPLSGGEQIFLPQSALAEDTLIGALSARGAHVTAAHAYETRKGSGGEDVPALLADDAIHALTFTSPSTVTYFLERIQAPAPNLPAACIGITTAQAAHENGFKRVLTAQPFSLDGLVSVLESL